jgi:hypothetical protein
MALGLLWSCQMEDVVTNSPNAIAARKKQPLPDGVPSEADDVFEFDKTQYYHNGVLIKDTTQIKEMVSNCRAMLIDGNRKDVYVTEQEATVVNNDYEALQSKNASNKAVAAIDGDNYLHYFYEVSDYIENTPQGTFTDYTYFSLLGPNTYNIPKTITYSSYTKESSAINPVANFLNLVNPNASIRDYLSAQVWFISNQYKFGDLYFTINVRNTTRFKRKVHFQSEDNRHIYYTVLSGRSLNLNGSQINNIFRFAGAYNFRILFHNSQKI